MPVLNGVVSVGVVVLLVVEALPRLAGREVPDDPHGPAFQATCPPPCPNMEDEIEDEEEENDDRWFEEEDGWSLFPW